MILDCATPQRPEIHYPTFWGYKLIGKDIDAIEALVARVLENKEYTTQKGSFSKNKKFVSFNVKVYVASEEERNEIFATFEKDPAVSMLI